MASREGVAAAVTVDPRTDPLWDALARQQDSAVFHSPAWIRAVSGTYGFPVSARVVQDNSGPQAGLVCGEVEGLAGNRLVSFPFSDYCDPLVSNDAEWRALTAHAGGPTPPMALRCLHGAIPLADDRWERTGQARWHGIDLSKGDPWERLHSSARRAIRRSRQAGVEVGRAGTTAELRAFFELHLRIRKHKYRMLAQPFAFFEQLWSEFASDAVLLLARVDGEVAAGVFYLEWRDTLFYKFNASDPAFVGARPNDALMWAGIEHAGERGMTKVDLGLSDSDQEGLLRYKRKYASEEKTITFLAERRDAPANPRLGRLGETLPELTRLLTDDRVPDTVTERAGAALYRFFA